MANIMNFALIPTSHQFQTLIFLKMSRRVFPLSSPILNLRGKSNLYLTQSKKACKQEKHPLPPYLKKIIRSGGVTDACSTRKTWDCAKKNL